MRDRIYYSKEPKDIVSLIKTLEANGYAVIRLRKKNVDAMEMCKKLERTDNPKSCEDCAANFCLRDLGY